MILDKTTVIKWSKANKKHFEDSGYIFTKYGDFFEAIITDLNKGSKLLISVVCDICGKQESIKYSDILKYNKFESYECKICRMQITCDKRIKDKLKSGEIYSFYNFCCDNDRYDLLERYDLTLNKNNPKEIAYKSNGKYYFKCPIGKHPSELKNLSYLTEDPKRNVVCNSCNSIAEYLLSAFGDKGVDIYWGSSNNISPFDVARYSKKKIYINCTNCTYHGEYEVQTLHFSAETKGCPFCSKSKVHKFDSVGYLFPESISIWGVANIRTPFDYSPKSHSNIWFQCENHKHDDYKRVISNATKYNFKCPECVKEREESGLQEKIKAYLNGNLGLKIMHERNCSIIPRNPSFPKSGKHDMPFDNEIVVNDSHLIIECHGVQHYQINGFTLMSAKRKHTTPEQELAYQQWKDEFKKQYAISKGYHYLEIPYWAEKDESYKTLIDNKISEILSGSCIERKAI